VVAGNRVSNFKLIIEYDGSAYHGWQKQADAPTIQETIETALAVMTRERIRLIGSGRTDAGVHALGQVANFHTQAQIAPKAIMSGLNSLLPHDIVIKSCEPVDEAFHARFRATKKTYHYRVLNRPLPAAVGRQYAWFIKKELNLAAMQEAAACLVGIHDFKSLEAVGSPRTDTIREVFAADLRNTGEGRLVFEISANGFLRRMVRNIVGTLVDVGRGKISAEDFRIILSAEDRALAGATAPAHGLFLVQVFYDGPLFTDGMEPPGRDGAFP